jgi:hypothetical protein
VKKLFLIAVALCLLSCSSDSTEDAGSNVSLKIEMPENPNLGSLSYSMYIIAVDSETRGEKYNHYCIVQKPESKARIPSIPKGTSIMVYAMLFPLEPVDPAERDNLPFFGATASPYKAEIYSTEPVTVQLRANSTATQFRSASGGKYYYINHDYTSWDEVHIFESDGTFEPHLAITARLLVAAGGGGGGGGNSAPDGYGGGGGAGYINIANTPLRAATSYAVTVGTGGAGGDADVIGVKGGYSRFAGSTINFDAGGGSGGGKYDDSGDDAEAPPTPPVPPSTPLIGGGGGGGHPSSSGSKGGGTGGEISLIPPETRRGGNGNNPGIAGGGGGMSAAGLDGDAPQNSGSGGTGISSDIGGNAAYYGGGGGGGGGGNGGSGAGGKGPTTGDGSDATGYGSGGGGGGSGGKGGNGKDGIVIVRFPYNTAAP